MDSYNALGAGERYHSYLRQIYRRFRLDTTETTQELALSILVRVLNDLARPNALTLTILVFVVIPRVPIHRRHLPDQIKHLNEMRSAPDELIKTIANNRIMTALIRNVSDATDAEIDVGDEVLMFRGKPASKWEGPYIVTRFQG